jgi:hypothetical protein
VNRGAHLFVSERTSVQISWPSPFSFRGRQRSGLLAAPVQNLMAADTTAILFAWAGHDARVELFHQPAFT